jgi:two-component system, sensor histidine kinase PdtaS
MKKKYVASLFIFIGLACFAQQKKIDSLIVQLDSKITNIDKIEVFEPLSALLINYATPEYSLPYFTQMAVIAKKLKKDEMESRAYKYIAECYMKMGDFKNAKTYARNALTISENSDDTNLYLLDVNQLGRVYHHFQKYNQAIETYNKGITRYLKKPQGNAICTVYSNLGTSYGQIGDKDNQIKAYLKGARYADELNSYTAKTFALYNLGYLYMELDQFEKSEEYFLKALEDSSKIEIKTYVYMNYHGLGTNYSRWEKYDKALTCNQIALNFYQSIGNKLYEFDVLNNIAVVYSKTDNPNKCIDYATQALAIAETLQHKLAISGAKQTIASAYINLEKYDEAEKILLEISKDTSDINIITLESKIDIYQNLASVYEGKKQYDKSLSFYKQYRFWHDSILEAARDSKIAEIETKYQADKKDLTILKQQNDIQKSQSNLLVLLLVLFGLATLLIAIYAKKLKNKLQKKELAKKFELGLHDYLIEKYDITNDELKLWIEIKNEKSEIEQADVLFKSVNTIKTWRKSLYSKLKAGNSDDANYSQKRAIILYNEEEKLFKKYTSE